MKAILYQIQRIFIGLFFTKDFVHHSIEQADKEEMMLALFCRLLERVFQSTFQKRYRHRRRHVKHFTTSRHLAVVAIIREFTLHQRLAVINAARIFANRVLHILCKERFEPEFSGLVRKVTTESHSLVAREKRRIALGANT